MFLTPFVNTLNASSPILPDKDLYSEPSIADTLNEKESIVSVGTVLVQGPGGQVPPRPDGDVPDHGDPHVRVGLQTEGQNGDTDEEDRDNTNKLKDDDDDHSDDDLVTTLAALEE